MTDRLVAGPLPAWFVAALMGVMVGLPTVGRHQTPGEQLADEAGELLPLAGGELVPEGRDRSGAGSAASGAGGDWSGTCVCAWGTSWVLGALPRPSGQFEQRRDGDCRWCG